MSRSSIQLEVTGLGELEKSVRQAAELAPKDLQRGLNRIKNRFKRNIKKRAEETFSTTENITSGFTMTQVKVEKGVLYSYFKPEARGNKGHAWHLQEFGYELTRPHWISRKNAIPYKNPKEPIRFIPGKHIVDKEMPSFLEYMGNETRKILDNILKESDLD